MKAAVFDWLMTSIYLQPPSLHHLIPTRASEILMGSLLTIFQGQDALHTVIKQVRKTGVESAR